MLSGLPYPKMLVLADHFFVHGDILQDRGQGLIEKRFQLCLGIVVAVYQRRHRQAHGFWGELGPPFDLLEGGRLSWEAQALPEQSGSYPAFTKSLVEVERRVI